MGTACLFKARMRFRQARARRAAELLRKGETNLERIAALTGFGSRQALARAFRRDIGTSPTGYWRIVHRRPFPRPPREAPRAEGQTEQATPGTKHLASTQGEPGGGRARLDSDGSGPDPPEAE